MSKKVRWGVVGTAKIAVEKVIPATQLAPSCEVVAIASRSQERADAVASALNIPKAYGAYEHLLADPDVDAIYIPLPNHLHVPFSIQALQSGKHVLCEKPIGLSSAEGQRLADVAEQHSGLKCMEAFMYRHHPQWQQAREWVRQGSIGSLQTIHSFFSYFNDDPDNIRHVEEWGGGGLMDIGCYPISLSRFLFETEPLRVSAVAERDPKYGTDRLTSAILDFGTGTATFTCGTQLVPFQRVQIFGTIGRIEIEIPFNAPPERPCRMWLQSADSSIQELQLDICDQYTIQAERFARSILDDTSVPTPMTDAVSNMRVIEAIQRAASNSAWERV